MENKELKTGRIYLKDGEWVVREGSHIFPIRKEDACNLKSYDQGKETCIELILIGPTGREVITTDVSKNQSSAKWFAKLWSTSKMVRDLQHYLETTPKEEIQRGWDEAKKNSPKGGPTVDEYFNPELYWKERCLAAELYIEKTPCDPDIYPEQLEAYHMWEEIVKRYEDK